VDRGLVADGPFVRRDERCPTGLDSRIGKFVASYCRRRGGLFVLPHGTRRESSRFRPVAQLPKRVVPPADGAAAGH